MKFVTRRWERLMGRIDKILELEVTQSEFRSSIAQLNAKLDTILNRLDQRP